LAALVSTPRVSAVARDYPGGGTVGPHGHAEGQLIHAISGVMELRAGGRLWLLPPERALWMPPRMVHELRARGPVSLRTLYLAPQTVPGGLGQSPKGYAVTPLLRELILRAIEDHGDDDPGAPGEAGGRAARRMAVLLDELAQLPADQLSLPMPADPRLERACLDILARPGTDGGMAALARTAGASVRTLARLAQEELGCSLSLWRCQARILTAVPLLIGGASVLETALTLGYDTPSAFAAAFKRLLGTTPRAFANISRESAGREGRGSRRPAAPQPCSRITARKASA